MCWGHECLPPLPSLNSKFCCSGFPPNKTPAKLCLFSIDVPKRLKLESSLVLDGWNKLNSSAFWAITAICPDDSILYLLLFACSCLSVDFRWKDGLNNPILYLHFAAQKQLYKPVTIQ